MPSKEKQVLSEKPISPEESKLLYELKKAQKQLEEPHKFSSTLQQIWHMLNEERLLSAETEFAGFLFRFRKNVHGGLVCNVYNMKECAMSHEDGYSGV